MFAIKIKGFKQDDFVRDSNTRKVIKYRTKKAAELELDWMQHGYADRKDCEIVPYSEVSA